MARRMRSPSGAGRAIDSTERASARAALRSLFYALLIGDYERFGFPAGEEEDDPKSKAPDFEAFTASRYDRHE
jgi:hypothetical protein